MSCVKHYADQSIAQLGKMVKGLKDKAVDKTPKFVSAIRQKVSEQLSNFTKAEYVAVTADGIEVTVSNTQKEASTLHNAMGKQHGHNHNKRPTFNDIKNEVSKDAKVQESVLRKKIIKPGPHGVYKDAPYHTINSKGIKNPAPINGQHALDNSLKVIKTERPTRIAVSNNEFVVLMEDSPGKFHGHVRNWNDLTPHMQNTLRDAGLVSDSGKIKKVGK